MIRTIVSIVIVYVSFLASMRLMSAMQYQDHATIFLDPKACPVALTKDNVCAVEGTLSHTFIEGDLEVTLPDGARWMIPQASYQGAVIQTDQVQYEPFGRIFAFVVSFGVLALGILVAVGDSLLDFRRKLLEARHLKA